MKVQMKGSSNELEPVLKGDTFDALKTDFNGTMRKTIANMKQKKNSL